MPRKLYCWWFRNPLDHPLECIKTTHESLDKRIFRTCFVGPSVAKICFCQLQNLAKCQNLRSPFVNHRLIDSSLKPSLIQPLVNDDGFSINKVKSPDPKIWKPSPLTRLYTSYIHHPLQNAATIESTCSINDKSSNATVFGRNHGNHPSIELYKREIKVDEFPFQWWMNSHSNGGWIPIPMVQDLYIILIPISYH